MGEIVFNGISSKEYDIQVEHPPGYQIPERDCDVIHVPGRNGDIVIDKGSYKNVERSYQIAVGSLDKDFIDLVNPISEWLHSGVGYCRLEDSYEPEYYRLAMFNENVEIDNIEFHGGRTTITFDCKPQRFFKSGDESIVFRALKTPMEEKVSNLKSAIDDINSDLPCKITFDNTTMIITKENRVISSSSDIQNQIAFLEKSVLEINASLPYKITFDNTTMMLTDIQRTKPYGDTLDQKILSIISCLEAINTDIPFRMAEESASVIRFSDSVRNVPAALPNYRGYSGGFIRNVTRFETSPIINIYGYGNCTLTIGKYNIIVSEVDGSITIDSQLMEVYSGPTNKNSQVSLPNGFPKLLPGSNAFSYSGDDVERVEVIPKWWTL